VKWTSIAPIRDSLWLNNHAMPLSFPNGVQIDLMNDKYRSLYSEKDIGSYDLQSLHEAKHTFLFQYEATGRRGLVEPMEGNISMASVALDKISLANLALWISKPNGLVFFPIIHFTYDDGTQVSNYSRIQRIKPHIGYLNDNVQVEDFKKACTIYQHILSLDRQGTTWRAIYSLLTALHETDFPTRFIQIWIGLEALFGPEERNELSYRISQRIAFFLKSNTDDVKELFKNVKNSYVLRSKIVHGLHLNYLKNVDVGEITLFVEKLISHVFLKELGDINIIREFENKKRDIFLDNLVFQK
jgi:Apea-like HEPN